MRARLLIPTRRFLDASLLFSREQKRLLQEAEVELELRPIKKEAVWVLNKIVQPLLFLHRRKCSANRHNSEGREA